MIEQILTTILTVVGSLGGFEALRYLMNRKANARKAESEADQSEFAVLRETCVFMQEQLRDKEKQYAEMFDKLQAKETENNNLSSELARVNAIMQMKLCERRGCPSRQPESGY